MSSNIRIIRICEYCNKEFEARKTTSKTCSDDCAKRAYKARQRDLKINASNEQVRQIRAKPLDEIRANDYLTVDESAQLARISRRSLYRLNERGELPFTKLGRRTVIRRVDIDQLFERPATQIEQSQPIPVVALSDCYTLAEIRHKYGISDKALHELIRRNEIPKQRKGKYTYVSKQTIDNLLSPNNND